MTSPSQIEATLAQTPIRCHGTETSLDYALFSTFTALYHVLAGIGGGPMISLLLYNRHAEGASSPVLQEETLLRRWLLEAVPVLGTQDIPTAIFRATMAGLCGFVIDLVLLVVGEFLACLNIPDRDNPDGVAKLFRVTVGVTRMIDITCRVLGRTPINGIALIQAEDIDIAYG